LEFLRAELASILNSSILNASLIEKFVRAGKASNGRCLVSARPAELIVTTVIVIERGERDKKVNKRREMEHRVPTRFRRQVRYRSWRGERPSI
jgi:hypothetical protein